MARDRACLRAIRDQGLHPRAKLLLTGPSGSGKTLTAKALAGELRLPLFAIMLDDLITKFMGETAAKLRLVFDADRSAVNSRPIAAPQQESDGRELHIHRRGATQRGTDANLRESARGKGDGVPIALAPPSCAAPLRSRADMRSVTEGIAATTKEEAAYWLGMAIHRRYLRRGSLGTSHAAHRPEAPLKLQDFSYNRAS
jgi:hypothetical protein